VTQEHVSATPQDLIGHDGEGSRSGEALAARAGANGRPRVLHVCEAFDGGVATAVHTVTDTTQGVDHTVLLVPRPSRMGLGWSTVKRPGVTYLETDSGTSMLGAMRRISQVYRELDPDIVHAHSSFAGVYVRCLPGIPRSKIVYSPHCLAFERTDVGRGRRAMFRGVEWALARRTGTFAACNEREAGLARAMRRGLKVVDLSHVPQVPQEYVHRARPPHAGEPPVVVGVGRLCVQKDPGYFAEVVRIANETGVSARWLWIGGGDDEMQRELEAQGVEVTGWMPRQAALDAMSASHVFLHTASWEAQALSVLEAAAIGLPVVARNVPSMSGAPVGQWISSPAEAAEAVARLASEERWHEVARRTSDVLRASLESTDVPGAIVAAYSFDREYVGDAPAVPAV
jgi:glycosyltransferase involved in cell wall biosynthesis